MVLSHRRVAIPRHRTFLEEVAKPAISYAREGGKKRDRERERESEKERERERERERETEKERKREEKENATPRFGRRADDRARYRSTLHHVRHAFERAI